MAKLKTFLIYSHSFVLLNKILIQGYHSMTTRNTATNSVLKLFYCYSLAFRLCSNAIRVRPSMCTSNTGVEKLLYLIQKRLSSELLHCALRIVAYPDRNALWM